MNLLERLAQFGGLSINPSDAAAQVAGKSIGSQYRADKDSGFSFGDFPGKTAGALWSGLSAPVLPMEMRIGDFVPGVSQVLSAQDASKAFDDGDYVGTALGALGALPGLGPFAKKGAGSIRKIFSDFDIDALQKYVKPPHEVRDKKKFDALFSEMDKSGEWKGRPILGYGDPESAEALTGSHRIAAAQKARIEIPVMYVDDSVYSHVDGAGQTFDDVVRDGDAWDLANFLEDAGDNRAAKLAAAEAVSDDAGFILNK